MNRICEMLAICLLAVLALPALAGDSLPEREERAIQQAAARVAPSVVRIETVGGLERIGRVLIGTGPTTGLVVSPDGLVVSSAFNFVQKPDSILVTLADGVRHPARLVATDHSRMLVVLKIEGVENLPVCEAAKRSEMRVGQWALSLGRTFELGQPNLSVGIVSALDRIWGKAIQTDAKISPNNYGGPLVDIAGRVLGVLVPMSPEGGAEVAGIEWYDSGIGFAIPLESILRVLPELAAGKELQPGLIGVSLKGEDVYSLPAEIAVSRAKGPAYAAGLRAGDTIVEINGHPIARQADMKQQLGGLYAGEKVSLVATRKSERIARDVELVGEIEAYEFPFLGVLPLRNADGNAADGVTVRYIFPGGPAAATKLAAADRIVSIAGRPVKSLADAVSAMQTLSPEATVKFEAKRGDELLSLEAKLTRLPETLPDELPASHGEPVAPAGALPPVGIVSLKFPEFSNACTAYVPEGYNPAVPHGVVVWFRSPGKQMAGEALETWKPICDKFDLIFLAPEPLEDNKWQGFESRFARRALDDLMKNYNVDPARVVAHGHEVGGAMAYLFTFGNTEVIRGVVTSETFMPRLVQPTETDPVRPLAIYTMLEAHSDLNFAVDSTIQRLRELKHPVTVKKSEGTGHYYTANELLEVARWIDTLDRL